MRGKPTIVGVNDYIDRSGDGEFQSYFRTGLKIYANRQFRHAEELLFMISPV